MSTKQSSKEIVDNIVSYALENNPSVLYIDSTGQGLFILDKVKEELCEEQIVIIEIRGVRRSDDFAFIKK